MLIRALIERAGFRSKIRLQALRGTVHVLAPAVLRFDIKPGRHNIQHVMVPSEHAMQGPSQ